MNPSLILFKVSSRITQCSPPQVPGEDQLRSTFMHVHTRWELSSLDWLMEKPLDTNVAPQVMIPDKAQVMCSSGAGEPITASHNRALEGNVLTSFIIIASVVE